MTSRCDVNLPFMSAFGGKADMKIVTAPSANPGSARLCIVPPPVALNWKSNNHRCAEYDTEAR